MKQIKVLVVSQQTFFRQGVWHSLSSSEDLDVMAVAEIDTEFSEINATPADVSLIDTDGNSGEYVQVAKRLKQRWPQMALILISSSDNTEQLFDALKIQAAAYLRKDVSPEELLQTIKDVARGEQPIQNTYTTRQEVATMVLHKFQQLSTKLEQDSDNDEKWPLTARELEILNHVARGLSNKRIAFELQISEQTIKNHVTSILRKLDAGARTEAVVLAFRQGMIHIS